MSDVTAWNNMRQIEKADPRLAKQSVDQAVANTGAKDLGKTTETAKKGAKVRQLSNKPSTGGGVAAGPAPSMAISRDRSQQEPGAAFVSIGARATSIFPATLLKPYEGAITGLVDVARKPGAAIAAVVATAAPADLELVIKHAMAFLERGGPPWILPPLSLRV